MKNDIICENISFDGGKLVFAGVPACELAQKYGTPLYVLDEDRIREKCRIYKKAIARAFGERGRVYYASKAASFKKMYEIMQSEGMGVDVVSSGEICTALKAGFNLENSMFHSNNKTDEDIEYGIKNGVGYFVADNQEELYAIERIASALGVEQSVLLRITPGIDPHTYAAISTGKVDSKFGSGIETGQAEEVVKIALSLTHVKLCGFHCHVGSQVFDSNVYISTADVMLDFIAYIYRKTGFLADVLDIGGGFGVRYTSADPEIDIEGNILCVGDYMKKKADGLGIELPTVCFEPGRSIVADAGLTLYTVGTVKKIPGYKNYVSVDGGMTVYLRFALYGAPYTLVPAARADDERDMTASVVGRCCESGDIIQEGVPLPSDIRRGDILACFTTGAYHYSMASNYNRIPRPAIVMLSGGKSTVAVKRETVEDLCRLDV